METKLKDVLLNIDSIKKKGINEIYNIAKNIIKLDYLDPNSSKAMQSNLVDGLEYLNILVEREVNLNESLIKNLHSLAVRNVDDRAGGSYRTTCSLICNSSHLPTQPFMLAKTMENIGIWLENNDSHPVIKAANILEKIFSVQPFTHGNIEVSALLMNLIMLKNNLPMFDFEYNKEVFYKELEKSNLEKEDKSAIELYIATEYLRQLQK